MKSSSIRSLLHEVRNCLKTASRVDPRVDGALKSLDAQGFDNRSLNRVDGRIPAHVELLDCAISNIPDEKFARLKTALIAAKSQLQWRIDDGGFYADKADVGAGYRNGNMHALLVGPEDSPIVADDFLLGFFLLAPKTLYRDHKHLAPEIYIPLTGPSGWRFGLGAWEDNEAGAIIYNAPNEVHATRVYDTPFLALFVWTKDIGSACSVVPADDWQELESELHNSSTNAPA